MKAPVLLAFALLASACADAPSRGDVMGTEMKIAFDLTDANPQVLLAKLETIEQTRKQIAATGRTPRLVLAFRGGATQYTQADVSKVKEADRADALAVARKLRELSAASGVESIEQCSLPLERFKLSDKNLLQPVKVVPNGWIALAAYQERGYSYIAP